MSEKKNLEKVSEGSQASLMEKLGQIFPSFGPYWNLDSSGLNQLPYVDGDFIESINMPNIEEYYKKLEKIERTNYNE